MAGPSSLASRSSRSIRKPEPAASPLLGPARRPGRDRYPRASPLHVQADSDSQPRRDRPACDSRLPRTRRGDGRHLQRGRPRRPIPRTCRRGDLRRTGQSCRQLPADRPRHQRRRDRQRAGDPSGLRFPLGELPLRRGLPVVQHRLHRPHSGGDGDGGRQELRPGSGPPRGRAHRAGQRRPAHERAGRGAGGQGDRLPGAPQGDRRRRRQGNAGRRQRPVAGQRLAAGLGRGPGGLRQSGHLP